MSTRRPPRRTARKRTRAEAISDEEPADTIPSTPTASETFSAALTQFTHTQSSLTRQTRRTRSRLEEDPDSSARSIISNEASSSTNNGPPLITNDEQSTKPKAARFPKKKVTSSTFALDTPHPTPPRWREAYDAIKEMRRRVLAPVDGMGCGNAGDVEQDPKSARLSILISLMLSSQTKDEVVHASIAKLRAAAGGTITLDAMLAMDSEAIQGAINKAGFWRKKTISIMEGMKKLQDDFEGDVPKTVEELTSLKGVGPKMAFLALQHAWNIGTGIGVDVHVDRITNRLGWHNPATKTPEQTRLNLQSWLPNELWGEINGLMVGFGQTICLPVGPRCSECTLAVGGVDRLCPSALPSLNAKGQTRKEGKPRSPMKRVVVETEMESTSLEVLHGTDVVGEVKQTRTKVEVEAVDLFAPLPDMSAAEDRKIIGASVSAEKRQVGGGAAPRIKIEFEKG